MALFSRNKPIVFHTASGFRQRRGVPRWLILLLVGIVLGAGGLLLMQTSYGPARLTVEASQRLTHELNVTTLENQRLQAQISQAQIAQQQAEARADAAQAELDSARATLAAQQADILALVARLPADPRGTSPGISAGTVRNLDGKLDYQILIVQSANAGTFTGKMRLIVEGIYPNERVATLDLPPVDIAIGHYGFVTGQLPLPPTFTARQATIRLTQGEQTRASAMRTLLVR